MATSDRRREQNRINKANQRARDRAAAAGKPTPRKVASYPARASAAREADKYRRAAEARLNVLRQLPSVNNVEHPEVGLSSLGSPVSFTPAKRVGRLSPARQAEAIRDLARSQKLVEVGRGRREQLRTELTDSEQSWQYGRYMSPEQQQRFQDLSNKIASIPLQAIGILFDYENGAETYHSAIGRLTGSPDSVDVEEGLDILAGLAEVAERAGKMYAPRAIGNLNV